MVGGTTGASCSVPPAAWRPHEPCPWTSVGPHHLHVDPAQDGDQPAVRPAAHAQLMQGTSLDGLPEAVRARLARLAPDQRAAAMAPPGPVLCVAPAGSGKTTTLVARIAWRVALGADPRSVCAVTFNRRAAEELRERLDAALEPMGVAPGTVQVRTFHALGMRILRSAGSNVSRLADRAAVVARLAGGPLPRTTMRLLDDTFTRLTLDPERGPGSDRPDLRATCRVPRRPRSRWGDRPRRPGGGSAARARG